jgi:chitinase
MPRFWLTSALPAGEWALKNIELAQAAQYLNFFNVMTYDFSGPWTKLAGHQAQLFAPSQPHDDAATISCQSAVAYFVSKGVHPKQLVLGIPAYGRSFLNANGIGQSYSGQGGEEGTFEYRDLPRPGTEEQVDETVGAAYCVGGDGGLVSYDNPATVRMKAQFVKQNDLQGLFYWTGTGDSRGPRSLVCTGFEELHSGR